MTEIKMMAAPCAMGGVSCARFQLVVTGHENTPCPAPLREAQGILMQTLGCWLACAPEGMLKDFGVDGTPGGSWCAVNAVADEAGAQKVCAAFEEILMGFYLLASRYPRYLRVICEQQGEEPAMPAAA